MAQTRELSFHPTSPRSSSGGAESFDGTPETRLSTFSPDDTSVKSIRVPRDVSRSASATPVKFLLGSFNTNISSLDMERDPFTTPCRRKGLSPTASTFQPFNPADQIAPRAEAEIDSVAAALSTELGLSRLLHLSYPPSVNVPEVEGWLKNLDERAILIGAQRYVQLVSGQIYIYFDDVRDACETRSNARLFHKDWIINFADSNTIPADVSRHFGLKDTTPGRVIVLGILPSGSPKNNLGIKDIINKALQAHGHLFAFAKLSSFPDGTLRALVEFSSAATAVAAVKATESGQFTDGIQLTLLLPNTSTIPQDLSTAFQSMHLDKGKVDVNQRIQGSSQLQSTASMQFSTFSMYPLLLQSPYGPGMPYIMDGLANAGQASPMAPMSPGFPVHGTLYQTPPSPALTSHNYHSPSRSISSYARSEARRQHAARINRSPHHNVAGHHNHVDIHRIRGGIDVRTTIMLRNIPNKVDQAMLNRIVDESSWGKYDFMYLRIDFANDCNVGYAFINFVDPLDIIDFVDARGNQRWNCFKSDKVAEISYATIQGKDCLVQKFRNSSVMLEAPHYRPKLYFTSNGPMPELAGQEEPFPEPDNQSKMKRSCENAEHVGLFTPNAGQHFRDEQRRRRSQYDRGTRLAALEEYDYESNFHQMCGPEAQ